MIGYVQVSAQEVHDTSLDLLAHLQPDTNKHVAVAALALTVIRLLGPKEGLSTEKEMHAVSQLLEFGISLTDSIAEQPVTVN